MRAAGGRVHTRRGRVDKRIVKARHRKAPGGPAGRESFVEEGDFLRGVTGRQTKSSES